jgi:hypothetical protein
VSTVIHSALCCSGPGTETEPEWSEADRIPVLGRARSAQFLHKFSLHTFKKQVFAHVIVSSCDEKVESMVTLRIKKALNQHWNFYFDIKTQMPNFLEWR